MSCITYNNTQPGLWLINWTNSTLAKGYYCWTTHKDTENKVSLQKQQTLKEGFHRKTGKLSTFGG